MFGHRVYAGRAGAVPDRLVRRGRRVPAAPVRRRRTWSCTGRRPAGRRTGARRGGAGDRRARRRGAPAGAHLQPGHAAAARDRAGDARAAGPAGARRADQRARPAADPPDARGAAPLRRGRADRAGVLAPAGRGRADLRPRRRHAPRPAGRGGPVDEIVGGGGEATFRVDQPDGGRRGAARRSTAWTDVVVDGPLVHADLDGLPRAEALATLVGAGVAVEQAGPRRRLEDAFLQLVGEESRATDAAPSSTRIDRQAVATATGPPRPVDATSTTCTPTRPRSRPSPRRPRTRPSRWRRTARSSATARGARCGCGSSCARQLRRRRMQLVLGLPGAAAVHPVGGVRVRHRAAAASGPAASSTWPPAARRTSWCSRCSPPAASCCR